jgi:uncharacterized protein (TIGR03435 family)
MIRRAMLTAILVVLPAFGQPAFDVSDVKPNNSSDPRPGKGGFSAGGRVDLPNATIKYFMMAAYGVQPDMIVGGPKWIESDRFDIVAKAPPDTPDATLRAMLQTLLADRFKLAVHREDRVMPTYTLLVGKNGPKMQESAAPGRQTCAWHSSESGLRQRECHNMTMAQLASQLPGWGGIGVDRPVVDLTELKGTYDFQFEVGIVGMGKKGGQAGPIVDDSGPTIFNAMTKLGLKLEAQKRAMSVIVIDHVERSPVEN